jgi:hypothetical protein
MMASLLSLQLRLGFQEGICYWLIESNNQLESRARETSLLSLSSVPVLLRYSAILFSAIMVQMPTDYSDSSRKTALKLQRMTTIQRPAHSEMIRMLISLPNRIVPDLWD